MVELEIRKSMRCLIENEKAEKGRFLKTKIWRFKQTGLVREQQQEEGGWESWERRHHSCPGGSRRHSKSSINDAYYRGSS